MGLHLREREFVHHRAFEIERNPTGRLEEHSSAPLSSRRFRHHSLHSPIYLRFSGSSGKEFEATLVPRKQRSQSQTMATST